MAHYHEPPAELTEAEWEKLKLIFESCGQSPAFALLREEKNKPQRAGDLFAPQDIRVKGRERVSTALRKAGSVFSLSRVNYVGGHDKTPREDHLLALVRTPK